MGVIQIDNIDKSDIIRGIIGMRPVTSKVLLPRLAITIAIIFITLYSFYQSALNVRAQQDRAGAQIAPAIIEDRIEPGDTFTGTVTITNLESEERIYRVVVRDISSITNGGAPIFTEPGEITGFELSQWVTPGVNQVVLQPGEKKLVPFLVEVPEGASPGGHFGGIFFSADAERQRETGAGVGYQVGTIMNFRIGGNIVEEAQIREFLTDKVLYGVPTVQLGVEVENLGNVLIRPRGPIDITDMFGKKVGTLRINDSGGAVLPLPPDQNLVTSNNNRRTFSATWEGEGLVFGRYEAIVALLYGEDGKKTISAATSFWVLPLRIILPILGTLLFVILVVYLGMRLYLRNRLRDMYRHTRVPAKSARNVRGSRMEYGAESPMPKLAVVAIALLVFTMIFLATLFFFFA